MTASRSYLDWNASAPLGAAARTAMLEALDMTGNASSVHAEGRRLRAVLERARSAVAAALAVRGNQVIFTSGASEAAAHALCPVVRAGGREIRVSRLYASAIEHPAVLSGGRFARDAVTAIPVTEAGIIDVNALARLLSGHDRSTGAPMVAAMLANNETGVIQPVQEIARIVHEHEGFLVVDAVQALGKMPLDVASLGAHFVILSSHKVGGPKGAGALILGDASISPDPLIRGGGQENFQRGGTENVAAIAGFAAAVTEIAGFLEKIPAISAIRDSIEEGLRTISVEAGNKAGEPVFFGSRSDRLPNTSCFAVPGVKAETALIALDLAGIAVSSGSACSSGKVKKSHVLEAMGVEDELARCALRISTGAGTTRGDAERFLGAWKHIVERVA